MMFVLLVNERIGRKEVRAVAKIRTGARTFLEFARSACRLSHIPGFKAGLDRILGNNASNQLYAVWTPFCTTLEELMALDDYFNKIDMTAPDVGGGSFTDEDPGIGPA